MAMVKSNTSACSLCGRALPAPEQVTLLGRIFVVGSSVRAACADRAEAQPRDKTAWERLCPKLYQKTDIARLENELRELGYDVCWLRDILAWQYGSQGLVISDHRAWRVGRATSFSRLCWLAFGPGACSPMGRWSSLERRTPAVAGPRGACIGTARHFLKASLARPRRLRLADDLPGESQPPRRAGCLPRPTRPQVARA